MRTRLCRRRGRTEFSLLQESITISILSLTLSSSVNGLNKSFARQSYPFFTFGFLQRQV